MNRILEQSSTSGNYQINSKSQFNTKYILALICSNVPSRRLAS